MKILGQPADYSEILQRVFYTSVVSGLVCTVLLAKASPAVQTLLDSVSTEADIGPLKSVKALYVLIPFGLGLISRMLKLHDRISDAFKIRYRFDTRYILFILVEGAGLKLTKELQKKIKSNRVKLMYAVFYPFAGFKNPVIDEQLVRTAADNWGWFWALIESLTLFVFTACILCYMRVWNYLLVCIGMVIVEGTFLIYFWNACRRSGQRQVEAILAEPTRKVKIEKHFHELILSDDADSSPVRE